MAFVPRGVPRSESAAITTRLSCASRKALRQLAILVGIVVLWDMTAVDDEALRADLAAAGMLGDNLAPGMMRSSSSQG